MSAVSTDFYGVQGTFITIDTQSCTYLYIVSGNSWTMNGILNALDNIEGDYSYDIVPSTFSFTQFVQSMGSNVMHITDTGYISDLANGGYNFL